MGRDRGFDSDHRTEPSVRYLLSAVYVSEVIDGDSAVDDEFLAGHPGGFV